jgi:MFS family permease
MAGGMIGLGFGTLMSALQAVAVAQVPMHRIGMAVSTYYFMLDVGAGLGPWLLSWLVQVSDYRTMYLVVAVVVAASAGLDHLLHGRKRQARPAVVVKVIRPDAEPAAHCDAA